MVHAKIIKIHLFVLKLHCRLFPDTVYIAKSRLNYVVITTSEQTARAASGTSVMKLTVVFRDVRAELTVKLQSFRLHP